MAAEPLEPRQLLAFSPFTGRDTTDVYMVPAMKVGDPPNPQWNMEKIRAADTWWVYDGNPKSIVVVEDYGVDFRHEDFGASATTQGQFWDFGKIHAPDGRNLEFSKKGRDDFNYAVDVGREITSKPEWVEVIKPDAGQYQGNIGASIIGAKTNNNLGVAGVNWDVQAYSAKVVVNDRTSHDIIARRANRAVHYLRLGEVADPARPDEVLQRNPSPQPIRAISFGYSSERDYGDIFHDFDPVPESAPDGAGHYDFIAFGKGIEDLTGDAKQGVLVTVPTGDYQKTWPTKYYSEGEWERWTPWTTWDPNWTATDLDNMRAKGYQPGDPDNVIAVAATDINDFPWEGNAFGNPIDIYAPGEEIVSAGEQPRGYVTESGTRQAQAHVAGAIALLYDAALQHEFVPTYHEMREAVIEGGDDIGQAKPRLNIVNSIKYLSLFAGKDLTRRPSLNSAGITISGGQAPEGNVGVTPATFTLTLSRPLNFPVTVGVSIQGITALFTDRDFVSPSSSGIVNVTIPARSLTTTFSIMVNGDLRVEADESFSARIAVVPAGVTPELSGAVATWTILNDDVPPVVSLADARALEGSALRPGFARVFATLDKPALVPVTLQYAVVNDTAVAGIDYALPATNVITFPVGV